LDFNRARKIQGILPALSGLRRAGLPLTVLLHGALPPVPEPGRGGTTRAQRAKEQDMETKRLIEKDPPLKKDDLIVIAGAGGFIAGNLANFFRKKGFTRIRAVDKKPLGEWYLRAAGVESLCLDVSRPEACQRVCDGAVEVYNLAADMGGMGFIERFRIECLRSILINTHMIEAAWRAGARRYFFSSSACAYNVLLQQDPKVRALKETDAYPAMAERGYGWEKLMSEMFCQEYWAERGLKTAIARFHNVYGPHGTWDGGREKAPAALCRKVIEAIDTGRMDITIWGDGHQTRSFMYIDDCVKGIDMIMHCDRLIATPINLGSSELVSINDLLSKVERIAGVKLQRHYDLNAPRGVAGRNSDNTFIQQVLHWEPKTSLDKGLAATYKWIKTQYLARKAGKRVVE
jgi:GDP-D-mannose 3', 5'-epimerase